jgi:hypothetical protein
MTRLLTLLLFSLGIAVAGAWTARPAAAAFMYSFTIDGFTDGASLTVSFDGADADADGVILGFFPSDCGCGTTEITSLSVSFTGNSLIDSFSGFSTDFTDTLASLWFDLDFADGFDLTYVLDPNGGFFLPDGSATGDAFISFGGMIDGVYTEIFGARCGTGFANSFGAGSGLCAVLSREGDQEFQVDFALDVPEPMSLALFGSSLGLLAVTRRRRSAAISV